MPITDHFVIIQNNSANSILIIKIFIIKLVSAFLGFIKIELNIRQ